ncbi:MAG: hypothetical protein ABIO70_04575 [Pseudomonadota bacterium]
MLDRERARAEADAAERRGASTLWATGPVAWESVSAGAVAQPEVVPVVEDAGDEPSRERPRFAMAPRIERRQDEDAQAPPTALLAAILARLDTVTSNSDGVPGWLTEAIGNPLTYDAAGPHRKDVCARVQPALYLRLQAMKARLGLRTTAGAWEYVLRAGLAAGERCMAARSEGTRDRV